MIDEVSNAETEADDLEDALARRMFDIEDSMKAVDVVFWYKIFELIVTLLIIPKKQETVYV